MIIISKKIYLELRHNANGDPALNGYKNYAAFDLEPYKSNNSDSVQFMIKVREKKQMK
ncbi:MAG: hypothetical protein ACLVKO_05360 [Dysgonomonas sp.]